MTELPKRIWVYTGPRGRLDAGEWDDFNGGMDGIEYVPASELEEVKADNAALREKLKEREQWGESRIREIMRIASEREELREKLGEAEKENGEVARGHDVILGWLKVERDKRRLFEKGLVEWRKKCHEKMLRVDELTIENDSLRSELSQLKRESVNFVALRKLAQAWMKYFEWQNERELAGKTWWGYPKPDPKRMTHSAGAKELAEEIASLCGMRIYRASRLARKEKP